MKQRYYVCLVLLSLLTLLIFITFYENDGYFKNRHTDHTIQQNVQVFSKLNPQNNQDFDAFLAESEPSLSLRSYRTTGKEPIKGDAATGENTSNAHLQYMNRTVDTCEDFYEHACGNYPNLKDVDIKYPKFSMFTRVDRKITSYIINLLSGNETNQQFNPPASSPAATKARHYYQACLNGHLNEEQTKLAIRKLIHWYTDHGYLTLETFLADVHRQGIHTLMKVSVEPDPQNSTQHQILFDIPTSTLTLQKTGAYKSDKNLELYRRYVTAVINILNTSSSNSSAFEIIKENIPKMWILEKNLAQLLGQTKQSGKVEEKRPILLKNFQAKVDQNFNVLNLGKYLEKLLGQDHPEDEMVCVLALDYFEKIAAVIKQTPKSVLVSYSVWLSILSLSDVPAMQYLLHPANVLLAPITGKNKTSHPPLPTKQKCATMTMNLLTHPVTWLYVQKYHDPNSFQKFVGIYRALKSSLLDYLNRPSHTWMTRSALHLARLKAESMQALLGFPQEYLHPKELTEFYKKLNVSVTSPVANQLNILQWKSSVNLEKFHQPYNRSNSWGMNPLHCNARYEHLGNRILFPLAILQEPFFVSHRPMSFNFGSIGFLFGHEMTHAFDRKAWNFHRKGEYTESRMGGEFTHANFKKVESCFMNQFSKYRVNGHKMNVNNNLDENVADSGGLFLAVQAFNTWLLHHPQSKNQTFLNSQWKEFFLAFAQTWCTTYTKDYAPVALKYDTHTYAKYRVIGALSNSKKFASTYKCQVRSPMNPPEKCSMW